MPPYGAMSTEKTNDKKREILDAFAEVIVEKGLEKASISNIAKQAGIPTSLIFYYFKNKDDLLHQLADYAISYYEASYFPAPTSADEDRNLVEFVQRTLRVHEYREDNIPISGKLYQTFLFICETDPIVKQKYRISTYMLLERFAEKLSYYHEQGLVQIDEPMEMAKLLECMINGLGIVWAVYSYEEYDAWANLVTDNFLAAMQYSGSYRKLFRYREHPPE